MKNVKCARCVKCGKEYEAVPDLTNCSCGVMRGGYCRFSIRPSK